MPGRKFMRGEPRKPATKRLAGRSYSSSAQGHGLDLVVGHVDHGGAQFPVQARQFDPGLAAQGRIQVGQRLVEQEDLGFAHDGAPDRDALALAARQRLGPALEQVADLKDLGRAPHPLRDLGTRRPGQLEREAHVLGHRHVRVQRIALEHHGDAAPGRLDVVADPSADFHRAGTDVFQAGDDAQQGRLAAARGTDQHHELAVGNVQVDALDDQVVLILFGDALQAH
jgi:hypothetical protein